MHQSLKIMILLWRKALGYMSIINHPLGDIEEVEEHKRAQEWLG